MDPVTALGLAAGILQFVDFGTKLFMTSYQTYKFSKGETDENEHIEKLTTDLKSVADSLEQNPRGILGSPSDDDLNLLQLARQSHDIAQELLGILEKVKRKGKSKTWGAVHAAMRAMWNKEEIQSKFQRLEEIRSHVNTRLLILVRYAHVRYYGPATTHLCSQNSQERSINTYRLY